MTLVQMPEFIARSKDLFSFEELNALQVHIDIHPESGGLMPGTGGIRKLRWALEGKGKRGGSRIVYYCEHGQQGLSKSEKNELRKLIPVLVQSYQNQRRAPWPRKSKEK